MAAGCGTPIRGPWAGLETCELPPVGGGASAVAVLWPRSEAARAGASRAVRPGEGDGWLGLSLPIPLYMIQGRPPPPPMVMVPPPDGHAHNPWVGVEFPPPLWLWLWLWLWFCGLGQGQTFYGILGGSSEIVHF